MSAEVEPSLATGVVLVYEQASGSDRAHSWVCC